MSGNIIRITPPRRGDRMVEPLHGPHETISRVEGKAFNEKRKAVFKGR